jgi:hypothetical protein
MLGRERTLRREAWTDLAAELKGEHKLGAWGRPDRVIVHTGVFELVLEVFTSDEDMDEHTRIRTVYRPLDDFHFKVTEDKTPDFIKNLFNMQDVRVGGDDVFNRRFRIQSNSETKVKALLENKDLRRLIGRMRSAQMEIKAGGKLFSNIPKANSVLEFSSKKAIRNPETLRVMFAIFSVTLQQMVKIGSAENVIPTFSLLRGGNKKK